MIQPIPNINGSAANDLLAPRMKAYASLQSAIQYLSQSAPHSRDYPLAPERYEADRQEHAKRLLALKDLQDAIINEAIAIRAAFDDKENLS